LLSRVQLRVSFAGLGARKCIPNPVKLSLNKAHIDTSSGTFFMGTLEDVRQWLKDIPLWRELGTIPDRTAALEQRVAELESKLGGKWPADVCRLCGERAARIGHSHLEN
jgi:hypothetical protein